MILRWDILTIDDPNNQRSKNQQDIYNKNINRLAQDFISDKLKPLMEKDFEKLLGKHVEITVDSNEP